MEHYFTKNPTSPHKIQVIRETLRGKEITFKTSSGVFSRTKVDFGTRVLVEAVKVQPTDEVLDVGCGYGVIGISLSFQCHLAVLLDINRRACILAKENIALNKVTNGLVVCGTPSCIQYFFDVVAMNPPLRAGKKMVFHLIRESRRLLKRKGSFYVVARTRQGAKSIFAFVDEQFSHAEYAALKGGYRVIKGIL